MTDFSSAAELAVELDSSSVADVRSELEDIGPTTVEAGSSGVTSVTDGGVSSAVGDSSVTDTLQSQLEVQEEILDEIAESGGGLVGGGGLAVDAASVLSVTGSLAVGAATVLAVTGALSLAASTVLAVDGTIDLSIKDILITTGVLAVGAGSVFAIAGALTLSAPAVLAVAGVLGLAAASVLAVTGVIGLNPDSFISVTGALTLAAAGVLAVTGVLSLPAAAVLAVVGTVTIFADDILEIIRGDGGGDAGSPTRTDRENLRGVVERNREPSTQDPTTAQDPPFFRPGGPSGGISPTGQPVKQSNEVNVNNNVSLSIEDPSEIMREVDRRLNDLEDRIQRVVSQRETTGSISSRQQQSFQKNF